MGRRKNKTIWRREVRTVGPTDRETDGQKDKRTVGWTEDRRSDCWGWGGGRNWSEHVELDELYFQHFFESKNKQKTIAFVIKPMTQFFY